MAKNNHNPGSGPKAKRPVRQQHMVTDHALLQYLARHHDVDVNAMKDELLGDAGPTIKFMKRGRLLSKAGHTLVIENGVVVTVV